MSAPLNASQLAALAELLADLGTHACWLNRASLLLEHRAVDAQRDNSRPLDSGATAADVERLQAHATQLQRRLDEMHALLGSPPARSAA